MGIRYRIQRVPDLHGYDPEYNKDGSEKHIVCDGARYHVCSYACVYDPITGNSYTEVRCSESNCEINRRADAIAAQAEGVEGG